MDKIKALQENIIKINAMIETNKVAHQKAMAPYELQATNLLNNLREVKEKISTEKIYLKLRTLTYVNEILSIEGNKHIIVSSRINRIVLQQRNVWDGKAYVAIYAAIIDYNPKGTARTERLSIDIGHNKIMADANLEHITKLLL